MLDICNDFSKEYYIKFNGEKSKCICFGNKPNNHRNVYVDGNSIKWYNSVLHLGNKVTSDLSDCQDICYKRGCFIQSVNKLLAIYGNIPSYILSILFNAYCSSFYGSQIWDLSCKELQKLYVSWHKGVRKIWRLSPRSHTNLLSAINNSMYISEQLSLRFLKLFHQSCNSKNDIVLFITKRAMYTCDSIIGRNLIYVARKYGVPLETVINGKVKTHIMDYCNNSKKQDGYVVRELCNVRDDIWTIDGFTMDNILETIQILCEF